MQLTRVLLQQATRQPMIRFIGQHRAPAQLDHSPQVHPASPADSLPDSFAEYRKRAQQHGPLAQSNYQRDNESNRQQQQQQQQQSQQQQLQQQLRYNGTGFAPGPLALPAKGEFFDRSELPSRFGRLKWTVTEIEAVESGGASLFT